MSEPNANAKAHGDYGISSIHFHDKLLRLPGDMYSELARRVATRRVAVMEEFLRTFHLQWDAKDVELTSLATEARASLGSFPKRSVKIGYRIRRIFAAILQPDPIN